MEVHKSYLQFILFYCTGIKFMEQLFIRTIKAQSFWNEMRNTHLVRE